MTRDSFKRLWAMSLQRKLLLAEVPLALAVAALRVRLTPFRKLVPRLGQQGCQASQQLSTAQQELARDAEWLIAALCRRLPVQPTCLMQAVAAKALLSKRGVPSTVYIGIAPPQADGRNVNAHAWLQCGERIVTGRAQSEKFKPMVWFG
jgi:hypothetical protein